MAALEKGITANGQGYRGRDLTQPSQRALTDSQLMNLIAQGISGTEMPATKLLTLPTATIWWILRLPARLVSM